MFTEENYLEEIHKRDRDIAAYAREIDRLERENRKLKETLWKQRENLRPERTGLCDECGEEFTYGAAGRKRRFCSNACKQAHHRFNEKVAELLRKGVLLNNS